MEPFAPIAVGLFLAVANQKIIEYFSAPVRKEWPDLNLWWLLYLALATGAAIAWFGNLNLFRGYLDHDLLGRVLSCILVGGGSSLIHDVFDKGASV